jgi:hypothetical protein
MSVYIISQPVMVEEWKTSRAEWVNKLVELIQAAG